MQRERAGAQGRVARRPSPLLRWCRRSPGGGFLNSVREQGQAVALDQNGPATRASRVLSSGARDVALVYVAKARVLADVPRAIERLDRRHGPARRRQGASQRFQDEAEFPAKRVS